MPNAYDPRSRQLRITHSPTARQPFEIGKLPKLDLAFILGSVRDQFIQQIKDLTGIDLSSIPAFIQSLLAGGIDLAHIPVLGDLIEAITGHKNGVLSDLETWVQNLQSKVFAGIIPVAGIADDIQNLLINPSFTSEAIGSNPVWSIDGLVGRTSPGAAVTTADGTLRAFFSNDIEVRGGQTLNISTFFKWTGVSLGVAEGLPYTLPFNLPAQTSGLPYTLPFNLPGVTTNAIHLDVKTFAGDEFLSNYPIVTLANITGASSDRADADADGWVQLAATYTIPTTPAKQVTKIQVRPVVDTAVLSGTVWVDDGDAHRTGLLEMGLVSGLITRFQDIFGAFGGIGAGLPQLQNFVANLKTWIDHTGSFDLSIDPGGFDPQTLIPQPLQQAIDHIFDGLHNDGVQTTSGNPLSSILDTLFGTKLVGLTGQDIGNTANTGVARIEARLAAQDASGSYLFDGFDYIDATTMPSTYTRFASSGGGELGPDGKGYVAWKPSGGQQRTIVYRRNDAVLTSDNGEVHLICATTIASQILSQSRDYLIGRWDATGTTRVQAMLGDNFVVFQSMVVGAVTNIGVAKVITRRDGDYYIFRYGVGGAVRRFQLVQNGNTVHDFTEVGTTSQIGATVRGCGFGGTADTWNIFFQTPCSRTAAFAMSDQAT